METSDKILLGLLLVAFAAFPVAVFLYLRTAYRKGGWADVRAAAIVALVAMLIFAGLNIWIHWEVNHFQRVLEHPFAVGSILFVVLLWLAHRALKAWIGEANDHH